MSKIVQLEVENVKRLKAVTITPDGALVVIRGNNGQGKTSVLDAIEYALAGKKSHPAHPIRQGTEKARVILETNDGIVVERRFTAGGTRLEVRGKDGKPFGNPQELLDGLVGSLSFDPLQFMREKPERQAEILRELVGVDFSLLEKKRAVLYDSRTLANRQVSQAKARLAACPVVEAPDELLSAPDLIEEQERRRAVHDFNEGKRRALQDVRDVFKRRERCVAEKEAEIAEIEKRLAAAQQAVEAERMNLAKVQARGKELRAEIETLKDPDLDEIPAKLREVEAVNERVRSKKAHAVLARELEQAEGEAKKFDAAISEIDAQKSKILAEAKFPVPGLAFAEGAVSLDGLPLDQASKAQQLRLSVAMGLALNPKMPILLVRDGSLLDPESMRLIAEMAEDAEAQIWIEVVGKGGVGIVIEDGEVESTTTESTTTVAQKAAHG